MPFDRPTWYRVLGVILLGVSFAAVSFVFAGLAAMVYHWLTFPTPPEMFGWGGMFLLIGVHAALLTLPLFAPVAYWAWRREGTSTKTLSMTATVASCASVSETILMALSSLDRWFLALFVVNCVAAALAILIIYSVNRRRRKDLP